MRGCHSSARRLLLQCGDNINEEYREHLYQPKTESGQSALSDGNNAVCLGGKPDTLTIASAKYEPLKNHKGDTEQKLVVSFLKTKKLLVVNLTNFDAIVVATGEADSDDWPGHKIELYPSEVQVGSEMKPCIRVRGAAQGELKPKAAANPKRPPAKGKADDDDMDDQIPY